MNIEGLTKFFCDLFSICQEINDPKARVGVSTAIKLIKLEKKKKKTLPMRVLTYPDESAGTMRSALIPDFPAACDHNVCVYN